MSAGSGMRLAGKRAIVTGAGRGIGLAISRAFLREEARVLLCDIDPALLLDVEQDLAPFAGRFETLTGDVSGSEPVALGSLDEQYT